jgi:hypothetical protein
VHQDSVASGRSAKRNLNRQPTRVVMVVIPVGDDQVDEQRMTGLSAADDDAARPDCD